MLNKNPDHKLVIHCAAGWGRTGSVVYLFYFLHDLIKNDSLLDFYNNRTFEEFYELFLNMLSEEWELPEDKILYSKKSVGELWDNIEGDFDNKITWNMYIFLLRIIESYFHPELQKQKHYSEKLQDYVSKSYYIENQEWEEDEEWEEYEEGGVDPEGGVDQEGHWMQIPIQPIFKK